MKKSDYEKLIKAAELRREVCDECLGEGKTYTVERRNVNGVDQLADVRVYHKCTCQKRIDKLKLEYAEEIERSVK